MDERAEAAVAEAEAQLNKRGLEEAASLEDLPHRQRRRIAEADEKFEDLQPVLPGIIDAEIRQKRADRAAWRQRLLRIEKELIDEPARVLASYEVRARRLGRSASSTSGQ